MDVFKRVAVNIDDLHRAASRAGSGYERSMIAANAQVHGLKIVTGNEADFRALGQQVLNPFTPA